VGAGFSWLGDGHAKISSVKLTSTDSLEADVSTRIRFFVALVILDTPAGAWAQEPNIEPDAATARMADFSPQRKFEIDLRRFIQDAQAEITGFQRDVETGFLAKVNPALDQVAIERSLWLVFNEDAGLIAWASPARHHRRGRKANRSAVKGRPRAG
jgi:hypothetical protein